MEDAHALTAQEVLDHFAVTERAGLSSSQVETQLAHHGRNVLPEEPSTPLWQLVLEQFKDQLVIILLGAAAISLALAFLEDNAEDSATAFVEPAVILLILIANAVVGVVQETNAEKAIEALMAYSPDEAKVVRDGRVHKIHASELVPGDVISLSVGDRVPADARLLSISSASFTIDQALLTGESQSVSKSVEPIAQGKGAVKQDMLNILFSGTTVVTGSAKAVVILTGTRTAIGDIHTSITSQISEKTPLKQKVDDFGETLAKVITVICILVWLVNIPHFTDPSHGGLLKGAIYYFKIAVALAVAAIPEGLPVVITTCLALGTKKMAKKNAIVRSLPSVETLGCTNVICADKTGTLTTGQMSVSRFLVAQGLEAQEYLVEGTSFAPEGNILNVDGKPLEKAASSSQVVQKLAQVCALCNDSRIAHDPSTSQYTNIGEPTEAALKVLVEKAQTADPSFNSTLASLPSSQRINAVSDYFESQTPRLLTFEFSRDRKSMSVLVKSANSDNASLLVKGAPDSILSRCSYVLNAENQPVGITPEFKARLQSKVLEYGKQGLRTLAIARRDDLDPDAAHYKTTDSAAYIRFEQNLTFLGLVGMRDPPRPEVRGAVAKCASAGIRIMVITGDERNTAETICRQIGIFTPDEALEGKSYTGREFDDMPQEEKVAAVMRASLFSRTEPRHKRQLVDLLQEQGLVVAMTGDGVNDAPALKRASIGIAMGSGTDVAKLAADMVLADNNFASIEQAVEEGRSIYENTKQFIRYLISSNIGEVVSIFLTVLLGMPEALIPVQLLFVNLVTDGLPATALGFNPPDHSIMRRPPRNAREPLVGPWLFFRYLVIGAYVGAATVAGYAWWFMYYSGGPQISFYQLTHFHQCSSKFADIGCDMFTNDMSKRATTISLSILVVIEMFNALNSLSENESLLTLPPWENLYLCGAIILSMLLHFAILYIPALSRLFVITPLNWAEWKAVIYISAPIVLIDELFKFLTVTFVAPPAKVKQD